MARLGINVDSNYQKASDKTSELRARIHPVEKRATTRPLFYTGFAALLLGGLLIFMH